MTDQQRTDRVHTIAAVIALLLIGVGMWLLNPGVSLAVVGGLLLAGVVYARSVATQRKTE